MWIRAPKKADLLVSRWLFHETTSPVAPGCTRPCLGCNRLERAASKSRVLQKGRFVQGLMHAARRGFKPEPRLKLHGASGIDTRSRTSTSSCASGNFLQLVEACFGHAKVHGVVSVHLVGFDAVKESCFDVETRRNRRSCCADGEEHSDGQGTDARRER